MTRGCEPKNRVPDPCARQNDHQEKRRPARSTQPPSRPGLDDHSAVFHKPAHPVPVCFGTLPAISRTDITVLFSMHSPQMGFCRKPGRVFRCGILRVRGQKGTAATAGQLRDRRRATATGGPVLRSRRVSGELPRWPDPVPSAPATGTLDPHRHPAVHRPRHSNAKRVPHTHWTLTSITRVSGSVK